MHPTACLPVEHRCNGALCLLHYTESILYNWPASPSTVQVNFLALSAAIVTSDYERPDRPVSLEYRHHLGIKWPRRATTWENIICSAERRRPMSGRT
jgi:hypothetical protein